MSAITERAVRANQFPFRDWKPRPLIDPQLRDAAAAVRDVSALATRGRDSALDNPDVPIYADDRDDARDAIGCVGFGPAAPPPARREETDAEACRRMIRGWKRARRARLLETS